MNPIEIPKIVPMFPILNENDDPSISLPNSPVRLMPPDIPDHEETTPFDPKDKKSAP